jgi:NhaP-type Na+/H+ or K+/H+ antiporter
MPPILILAFAVTLFWLGARLFPQMRQDKGFPQLLLLVFVLYGLGTQLTNLGFLAGVVAAVFADQYPDSWWAGWMRRLQKHRSEE